MAEPDLPTSGSSSSSSHKRRFDAMGPDGDVEPPVVPAVQNAGSSSTIPLTRSSSAEARRERNKRARNDMSDSSYTSEVDDLLMTTVHSVSPSSSDSSQSSYHSAHSVIPTLQSPSLVEHAEDEDDMLVDPVIPEPSAVSTPPPPPSFLENMPSLLTQSRGSPRPPSAAASRGSRPSTAVADEFTRSVERAVAFDRALAPLRRSPAVHPASSSGSAGPLPSLQSIDDFAIGLEIESFLASAQPNDVHSDRGRLMPRTSSATRSTSSSSSRGAGALPPLRIPDDFGFDLDSLITSSTRPSGSSSDRREPAPPRASPTTRLASSSSGGARPLPLRVSDEIDNMASLLAQARSPHHNVGPGELIEEEQERLPRPFFWLGTHVDDEAPSYNARPTRANLGRQARGDAAHPEPRVLANARPAERVLSSSPQSHASTRSRRSQESQEDATRRLLDMFPSTHSATVQAASDGTASSRVSSPRAHAGSTTRFQSPDTQDAQNDYLLAMLDNMNPHGQTRTGLETIADDMHGLLWHFDDTFPYPRHAAGASRTRSQGDSRTARARTSPRVQDALPNPNPVARDIWSSDHERRVQEVMREADAHTQRMVQLLSEPLPRLPTFSPILPTSSYSTLRHALDDHAMAEGHHHGHGVSGRPTGPSIYSRGPREPSIFGLGTVAEDYTMEHPEQDRESSPIPQGSRNYSLPWSARGPFRARTVDESFNSISGRGRTSPSPSRVSPFQDVGGVAFGTTTSYLEANSRARSIGLSELRNIVHPPPSPPPLDARPPTLPSSRPEPGFWDARRFAGDPPSSRPSRSFFSASSARRTAEDNAMLQSFRDSAASASREYPQRAARTAAVPSPLPPPREEVAQEDRDRMAQYGNINLDAYRDGPFRATLARSLALQQQRTRPERRDSQSNPEDDRGLSTGALWSRRMRGEDSEARPETIRRRPEALDRSSLRAPAGRTRDEILGIHPSSETSGPRSITEFAPLGHPRANASLHNPARPLPAPSVATLPSYDMLSELTESHSPSHFERRPSFRQRSLLDRDHAPDQTWRRSGQEIPLPPRASTWSERRRDTYRLAVQQMEARRAHIASTRNDPSDSATRDSTAPNPPHWQRRYGHQTSPLNVARSETRAEDRPAPLNGRFARRTGPGQHHPPDMVFVDVPPSSRRAHVRRRHFGDYVRDEDFDFSYEGLITLSSILGDVKPRGTPSDVIASLPRGTYSEWARPGTTEERCPICLDDYEATDPCLRIGGCSHWFHEGCLQQWLKGSRTCPVCRGRVSKPRTEEPPPAPIAGPSSSNNPRNRREDSDSDDRDENERFATRYWNLFGGPPWRPN